MSPATYRDIMSYCGPYNWISLHNYRQLTDHPSLAPQNVCRPPSPFDDFDFDPWWWLPWHRVPDPPPPELAERLPVPERLISLIGTVRSPMEVEVTSVMRVDAFREVRGGRSTDYTAELIGADGKPVARAPLFALLPQGCGCGCQGCDHERSKYPFDFQAFISNLETGAALAIRDFEGKEVWTRNPSQEHPAVAAFRARAEGVFLALSWDIRVAGSSQPHCWVQWSADGGRRWQGLATRLSGNEARLEVPFLPPGPILLRFCVSDGFETAVSATETVEIPEREPQAGVLGPRPGQKFMAGQTIRVWGYGTGTRGEELAGRSARWYLDDSEAALGFDVFLEAPEPGEHRLTLVVEDAGFRAHSSVVFITLAQPESAGA
jgi:hypothetical protein